MRVDQIYYFRDYDFIVPYNQSTILHIMNKILIVCLCVIAISGFHVLKHFDRDIGHIKEMYHRGQTSKVFSIFMKMLFQTKTLYEELKIQHPIIHQDNKPANCSFMMKELVDLLNVTEWTQLYQEIYIRLHKIQQKCTNKDFIKIKKDEDNGFDNQCALCTVLSRVIENYIKYHRKDIAKVIEDQFCSLFDGLVKPTCQAFTHYAGPYIMKGILNKQNSDVICHAAGMCQNPKCKILDQRSEQQFNNKIVELFDKKEIFNKPAPWQWLIHLFTDRFGDKHNPPFDLDNDSFSDISTFRGYHWRGADCNQFDSKVYPGRRESSKSKFKDHDCNQIFGIDNHKESLQDKLCGNSTRLGIAVVGDSAGAHFSIPQRFFNVTMMHKGTFNDLLPKIADQLDIPQQSAYTGHTITQYPTHSVYKHLRKWNICNNNDFQNLGVNGGDSGNSWGNIKALKRDQKNDHPMILFLELIGNDVCGSSLDGMTKPAQFKSNILKLLNWLDTTLPMGSHVVILGLAQGDLLFQYLHGTIHPLDVTYDKVYDFLNCLKISPCFGWLNTNQTARKYTTQYAMNLSKLYKQILNQGHTFKHFDIVYHDFPMDDMFKRMYLQNREPGQMIERCDGFHPSGLFNSYLGDWLWFKIVSDHPEWIGDENPNNAKIKQLFGLKDLI